MVDALDRLLCAPMTLTPKELGEWIGKLDDGFRARLRTAEGRLGAMEELAASLDDHPEEERQKSLAIFGQVAAAIGELGEAAVF